MQESEQGKCAVCGKDAVLKCSNCRIEFYCDKDHQRQDWSRHKKECQVWKIGENSELGRHLIATRDLEAGDIIISELPLIWGPAPHVFQRTCVGCGKNSISKYDVGRCEKCLWPACSPDCSGLVDKNRHGTECALLSESRIVPRCDILLAIRMLILWRKQSKRWTALTKLQSHEESRPIGSEAYNEVLEVFRHIEPLVSNWPNSEKVLPKICGLIDVNALETIPPEGSVAIYQNACLLEHSCLSNTRHSFVVDEKGRPRIIVRATTPIKRGEHLSTMYTHALWSTKVRRDHLLATKYFTCCCKRCSDPTELGTHLGTLKCPCQKGYILPNNPLDPETEWSCDACPGALTSAEVMQLTDKLEEQVEEAMKTPRKEDLSDLLSRLYALLYPGHQYCITVGHSLIQLLMPQDPQKPELCERIVRTVTTLDPHGVRLALYTAIALRELATCPGQDARSLLSQAVTLLKPQPPNSPGEKLMKLIEQDLST